MVISLTHSHIDPWWLGLGLGFLVVVILGLALAFLVRYLARVDQTVTQVGHKAKELETEITTTGLIDQPSEQSEVAAPRPRGQ